MSTIESPTIPMAPPAPSRQAGRGVPITIGAVMATVGSVLALGGGGVLALAGTDGTLESGTQDFSTSASALTSGVARIDHTDDFASIAGKPTVRVKATAAGDPDVFVGVARAGAVDRYLAGAATTEVTDLDVSPWGTTDKERHPGDAKPKPPAKQSFWVEKASGRTASIDWKVRDGNYRLVVMNADASRGVVTDSDFELELPHVGTIALVTLIAGLSLVAGGVVTMTGLPKRRES